MKFANYSNYIIIISLLFFSHLAAGQTVIRGKVVEVGNGSPLLYATVIITETGEGKVTDLDGNFEITTSESLPLTLSVSYTGFGGQEVEVTSVDKDIVIRLVEDAVMVDVIEVKGRRISEKQVQNPLTVETLDNIAIKETPAANFYDGLGSLKDVDLTAASLGFKIINTRGFNSTSPVRSLQIIDGVDNQSPGLNFSLGNFLGASELDVNRVNLIVGAASAFYGPSAFNGVIAMETKDPFLQKGLSAMVKGGDRNLFESGIRWADSFKNKNGREHIAYKLNFSYFRADDWEADNFDPVFQTDTLYENVTDPRDNPGGYDAVNEYGDEYNAANDLQGVTTAPGLNIFHRRGYEEVDLVDYDSDNLKLGGAVHFRFNPELNESSPELILASNYSTGTTVYQGDNRFSLRNIEFFQHRLEFRKRDNYFLRFYVTHEDAGDSYDPYFTALKLQEASKTDNQWRSDYINYWQRNISPQIRATEGFPRLSDFIGMPEEYQASLDDFFAQEGIMDSLVVWHAETQIASNRGNPIVNTVDFFEPGTERFQEEFDDITSRIGFSEDGTRFFDRSALYHAHGEYRFNDVVQNSSGLTDLDLLVGANYRLYTPDSRGSILLDTAGRDIDTYEYGVYGGGVFTINNRLKISASLRLDKNQNFDFLFSPAASLVYSPDPNQSLRVSFSSAVRNPTLADQYLFYNVGRAILIGNLDGFENLLTVESTTNYLNTLDEGVLDYFDVAPIRPEQVRTIEAGYRTTLFEKLYLDATYYYSFYNNFIGFNLGVDATFDPITGLPTFLQVYRVSANATDNVTTQGFSIGANYYFGQYFVFNGNYSWNKLNSESDDPIIPAFNTPEHKFNLGVSGRDIPMNLFGLRVPSFGFNVNYKWIDTFLFEGSPQFTGIIPQYDLLDAQVNWRVPSINTTFKLGASNILDNQTFQTYGGPRIGRLAYLSATYEWQKK